MTIVQAPSVATPVTWLEYPDWLTLEQVAELTAFPDKYLKWITDEGCVEVREIDGEVYVEKSSLEMYRELLADILHWDE